MAAVGARELGLRLGRHRAEHGRAQRRRPLAEEDADAAGGGLHQHHIAGPDLVDLAQQILCGHALQHHRRRRLVGDAVGDFHQPIRSNHPRLAVAARNRRIRNAIAGLELGDLGADSLDHSGALVAGNKRQAERKAPVALVDLDIVEAHRCVAQPHFVRPDIAHLDLFPAQDFGAAILMNANSVGHLSLSLMS